MRKPRKDAKIVRDARTIKQRAVEGVIWVAIILAILRIAWLLENGTNAIWPAP
jgi:hypothetical protein